MAPKKTPSVNPSTLAEDIAKAAALDLEIKALTKDLEPIKGRIKNDTQGNFQTYVGAEGYFAKIERDNRMNPVEAMTYADLDIFEQKISPAKLKAALMARYPKKWEEKLAECYTTSSKITFGHGG